MSLYSQIAAFVHYLAEEIHYYDVIIMTVEREAEAQGCKSELKKIWQ